MFRSRIYLLTWAPVWLSGVFAETPNPAVGRIPWAIACTAATVAVWPLFVLLGRLVARVGRPRVRQRLIPFAFGVVGVVRGVIIGVLSDQFALLEQQHWGVRILGGLFAGVILTSAVAAVEGSSARLVELQRDARRVRRERDADATPFDEAAVNARWIVIVREALDAHFTERPWTSEARAALERSGPARLAQQITRRLETSRQPSAVEALTLRARLSDTAHIRRLVELATARGRGVRAPLAVTLGLVVVAIHGGSTASPAAAGVTALAALAATGLGFLLATALEGVCRRALRPASLGARFVAITLGLTAIGLLVGGAAGLLHRLLLGGERPTVPLLLVGMMPAVSALIGWASMVLDGVTTYSTLLSLEKRQADSLIDHRRDERERLERQAARRFDLAVSCVWLPIVRAIARESPSWLATSTRDRVVRSVAALERAVEPHSVRDVLDALSRDWHQVALVDCVVDDDVMQKLAALPESESTELISTVRARVVDAVVERGAHAVEITIRAEGAGFAVDSWHDGSPGTEAEQH